MNRYILKQNSKNHTFANLYHIVDTVADYIVRINLGYGEGKHLVKLWNKE